MISKKTAGLRRRMNAVGAVFVGIAVFAAGGCATTERLTGDLPREITSHAVRIGPERYVRLHDAVEYLELDAQRDPAEPLVRVRQESQQATLSIGSPLALFNGRLIDMGVPVREYRGQVLLPLIFFQLFAETLAGTVSGTPAQSVTINRIVIDAGHGGHDPGAVGRDGTAEKDVVLDIARRVAQGLDACGIQTIMTRADDVFIPLEERSRIANAADADLFISIHANSAEATGAQGFEAYYLSDDYDDYTKSVARGERGAQLSGYQAACEPSAELNAILWQLLLAQYRRESCDMAQTIGGTLRVRPKVPMRFVKGAQFAVLKGSCIPAVLLEVGFLSNQQELERLNTATYRQQLADGIVKGIVGYKERFELSKGFSQ